MRCPFLREAQVKSCAASDVKKMIVRLPDQAATERCTSPAYATCPSARHYRSDGDDHSRCPFLQESLVQYCAAAPVVKYIPYSESSLSRCGTERHAGCALYAAMAAPARGDSARPGDRDPRESHPSDAMPEDLWFSQNHMWLDTRPSRRCRIGIDAFFAGLFRDIDAVEFPRKRGHAYPEVVVVSDGTPVRMTFPKRMLITGVNERLRTEPRVMLADPYGAGWLVGGFDMCENPVPARASMADGLKPGNVAWGWMKAEEDRLTRFVHNLVRRGDGLATMADGGRYQAGLFPLLDAARREAVIARFFRNPATKETAG